MHEEQIILQPQRPRFIDTLNEPTFSEGWSRSVRSKRTSSASRNRSRVKQRPRFLSSHASFSVNLSRSDQDDSREHRGISNERQERSEVGLVGAFSSNREKKRKERNKLKAEKMFARQFGDDNTSTKRSSSFPSGENDQPEGAPRPALYKGQMGAKHRKSSKMQQQVQGQPSSFLADRFSYLLRLVDHPAFPRVARIATLGICICIVSFCLYTPAQHFYHAQRENERLVAEYSVIKERNNALDIQNDILASKAGMEDAVRKKLGYVKDGENAAVVTGLSDATVGKNRKSENVEASVLSRSVQVPEAWYTPFLDTFFHYE